MNELTVIETLNPVEVFVSQGLEPIISKIESEARSIVLDISTEKGRKQIASLAYKIAQSKTTMDELGKGLTEEWKTKSKAVDAERKRMRERMDALKEEIRAPLTEWENAEKERIARHESGIAKIIAAGRFTLENWQTLPVEAMKDRASELESDGCDWQEFSARANAAKVEALASIAAAIQKREAYDLEQAELARLRQEEAERKQREHEERLQAEAAAKAKAEAEAKARQEAEAEAARVKAAQEKAEQERLRIQRDKEAAEARAKQAEADRLAAIARAEADRKAAEEKAERDRLAAAEQAKRDAEAAAKRERDRIEAERKAEAEAAAKREADKKHRAKVNNALLASLTALGLSDELGRAVIEAMAKGLLPNVKILY